MFQSMKPEQIIEMLEELKQLQSDLKKMTIKMNKERDRADLAELRAKKAEK